MFSSLVETCRKHNQWSESDTLAHVKTALRGKAAQVMMAVGSESWTFSQLVGALQQRFGGTGQAGRYRELLMSRQWREDESLQDYYAAVVELSRLDFPGKPTELSTTLSIEAICRGPRCCRS